MKKLSITILSFFTLALSAQVEHNALLWKISGNGLKDTSYLFGTIHALPKAELLISDSLIKYLDRAAVLVLELDLDLSMKDQVALAKRMMLPEGKTVKDYMDSTDYQMIYCYLTDSIGISEKKLRQYTLMKPFFFESMIMFEIIEDPVALETELTDRSKDKTFIPLETLMEQMDIIDSIPLEAQLQIHGDSYKSDKEYEKLKSFYLSQDLKGIEAMVFGDAELMSYETEFLSNRNLKWEPKIKEIIVGAPSFIAVGAAHLVGENGLINLLEEDGYALTPVFFNPE
ncbi:MAG: TraB/GumN family protein [Bacteroidales bacterium]|nr:TraB/GumN family protein [Bacteroidales bacterium]